MGEQEEEEASKTVKMQEMCHLCTACRYGILREPYNPLQKADQS